MSPNRHCRARFEIHICFGERECFGLEACDSDLQGPDVFVVSNGLEMLHGNFYYMSAY